MSRITRPPDADPDRAGDGVAPTRLRGRHGGAPTADDVLRFVRNEHIRIVGLMHVGSDGWLKTLDFAPRSDAHLRGILLGGERADGSSLLAGIPGEASDITLRPRLDMAFVDPFAATPTLVLLCGHAGADGDVLPESPDTIVRRAFDRVHAETGHELWAHGEVEYFLGRRAGEHDVYGADDRGYHAASPFVFGETLRRRAMTCLADLGIPVKYGHSEVGYIEPAGPGDLIWEQHEIELDLLPLPAAADAIVLTQWVLRNLAHAAGFQCSTDPVMSDRHPGNGLHLHLSPVAEGRHLDARTPDGALGEPARWLVGGLMQLGAALMAFGNRSPGSFTRLHQGREAPQTITWGDRNRSALVRLPAVATTAGGQPVGPPTIEFRLPDGSAHPHLVLAGIAQAMLLGRGTTDLDALLARTAAPGDGHADPVPRNRAEVAAALADRGGALEAGAVFPRRLLDGLVASLREESDG